MGNHDIWYTYPADSRIKHFRASRGTGDPYERGAFRAATEAPGPIAAGAGMCQPSALGLRAVLPNSRQLLLALPARGGWSHARHQAPPACRPGGNTAGEAGGSAGALQ